jgi:hypothetical protein
MREERSMTSRERRFSIGLLVGSVLMAGVFRRDTAQPPG